MLQKNKNKNNIPYTGLTNTMNANGSNLSASDAINTTPNKSTLRRKILSLAIVQAMACGSTAAYAANITVTNATDTPTAGTCTLREAINAANTDAIVGGCPTGEAGTDTINFDNSLSGSKITLGGTELLVNSDLTIDGDLNNDGTPDIEINAGGSSRVINVYTGIAGPTVNFNLDGLTISGGDAGTSNGGGIASYPSNNITISNSTISGNTTTSGGKGGGVSSSNGGLTVTNSTISGNSVESGGGGIFSYNGTVTVTNSTLSNNIANSQGGAMYAYSGNLNITGSTLSGNTAPGSAFSGLGGRAAAILTNYANVSLTNSTVSNNIANDKAGAISTEYGNVTLTDSTLSGNTAGTDGGAISTRYGTISLTDSTLSGNTAGTDGGAISTRYGTISLTDSTLSGNTASTEGGAISTSYGTINLTNSTLSGNTAGTQGGAIYTDYGNVNLTNSTLSGNTATSYGGAISFVNNYNYSTKYSNSISIMNSTISGNTSNAAGGGINAIASGSPYAVPSFSIINSILASNTNGDCTGGLSVTTDTANLVEDGGAGCGMSPLLTVDPQLGTLADNGGPTLTHLPMAGSPVLDVADNSDCGTGLGVATDQRGAPRDDGSCDIGAVEGTVSLLTPASVQFDATTATVSEDGGTVTLNLTRSGDTASAVSVDYTTGDGSATAPADYTADTNTLNFAAGVTSQSITVSITDDSDAESDETFSLTLSNVQLVSGTSPVELGANTTSTVTITDNDAAASPATPADSSNNDGVLGIGLMSWWPVFVLSITGWLRRKNQQ